MRGLSKLYLCACEREGCLSNSELVRYFMELDKCSLTDEDSEASRGSIPSSRDEYKSIKTPSRTRDDESIAVCEQEPIPYLVGRKDTGGKAAIREGDDTNNIRSNFRAASHACHTKLDLSKNYLGDAGLAAVFRVLPLLGWVTHVNAQGCGAGKQAVRALCDVLTMELPITTSPSSSNGGSGGVNLGTAGPSALFSSQSSKGDNNSVRYSSYSPPLSPELCFGTPLLPLEVIDLRANSLFVGSGRMLCKALQARHRLTTVYRQKFSSSSRAETTTTMNRDANFNDDDLCSQAQCKRSSERIPVDILPVEVLVDYDGFPPSTASTLRALNQSAHEEKQRRGFVKRMRREEEQMKIFCVSTHGGGVSGGVADTYGKSLAWKGQPIGEHLIYRIPNYTASPCDDQEMSTHRTNSTGNSSITRSGSNTALSVLRTSAAAACLSEGNNAGYLSQSSYVGVPFYDHSNPYLSRVVGEINQYMEEYLIAFRCLSRRRRGPDRVENSSSMTNHALHQLAKSQENKEEGKKAGEAENNDNDEEDFPATEYVENALAAAELCVDVGAATLTFLPCTNASLWYSHYLFEPSTRRTPFPLSSCSEEEGEREEKGTKEGEGIIWKFNEEEELWCAEVHHHVGALLRGFYANPHLEKELEEHRGPVLGMYMAELKELFYSTTAVLGSDPQWRKKYPSSLGKEETEESGQARGRSDELSLSSSPACVKDNPTCVEATSSRSFLQQVSQLESLYYRIVVALVTQRMSDIPSMEGVEKRLKDIRAFMVNYMCEGKKEVPECGLRERWLHDALLGNPSVLSSSSSSPSSLPSLNSPVAARGAWPAWCAETKYFLFNEAHHRRQWNAALVPREGKQTWWIPRPLLDSPATTSSPYHTLPSALAPPPLGHDSSLVSEYPLGSVLPTTQPHKSVIPPRYRSLLHCSCNERLASQFSPFSPRYTEEKSVRVRRQGLNPLLPRPCPSCCHAALSVLPNFFRDPAVLRRMSIQQKIRDALPMELKLFFLDLTIRRRSRAGYIPRIFGVGTRLFSKEIPLLSSIIEGGGEVEEEEEEVDVFIYSQYPHGNKRGGEDGEDSVGTAPSPLPTKRQTALDKLLEEWASQEKTTPPKDGMDAHKSPSSSSSPSSPPSDGPPLPRLRRRHIVSIMDYFAVVDGKPNRMVELLKGFEEWYRLMMVESFDVGHPSSSLLLRPSSSSSSFIYSPPRLVQST